MNILEARPVCKEILLIDHAFKIEFFGKAERSAFLFRPLV